VLSVYSPAWYENDRYKDNRVWKPSPDYDFQTITSQTYARDDTMINAGSFRSYFPILWLLDCQ
jgi:hypothetical protein